MRILVLSFLSFLSSVAVAACVVEPDPATADNVEGADLESLAQRRGGTFLDEVIEKFGIDGEACRTVGREVQCATATREKPLRVGDAVPRPEDLSVCARSKSGTLDPNTCRPIIYEYEISCDANDDHHPWMCEWIAANCERHGGVGGCGDCDSGDCCCKFED
jgi:hypothetical protein